MNEEQIKAKIEELKKTNTIIIEVMGGVVQEVSNLPEGWLYQIIDYDDEAEKGEEEV